MRIAVIGAGLAGLVVARELREQAEVTVFEKSRGVGGRMATRYAAGFEFDHGAQFFTARSAAFQEYLRPLIERGVVAGWHARFAELDQGVVTTTRDWNNDYPHYVGAPRMNAVGGFIADGLEIRRSTMVARLQRECAGWQLLDTSGSALGRFDWVVCTLPAAQTAALIPADTSLARTASAVQMQSCFALMLGFEQDIELRWQAALVRGADISWVSVNSSKPGRPDRFTLVVHSTNAYAEAHFDDELAAVTTHLVQEASALTDIDCAAAVCQELHRWRYANADRREGPGCSIDAELQLGGCGDWFRRGRVEAAFSSGHELAGELRAVLK